MPVPARQILSGGDKQEQAKKFFRKSTWQNLIYIIDLLLSGGLHDDKQIQKTLLTFLKTILSSCKRGKTSEHDEPRVVNYITTGKQLNSSGFVF
ncbi:hypothetical protein B9J78_05850 [bacterium Unc6]|nr:hypothetical protein [bacterium Unc6]